ncbi:TetR/AcrR family transcriptional regulator [Jeotgalibacillus marinus]|uniref:TetR/AcrR family transcriptional regulator n=1 Tax=Jeotgalibacillus marinus TaxID=86667 RepID=A0ABV3Q4A2_9BACL
MSKKKQDLLEHAEELFYKHGFHSIGLKQIVNEAGVAIMTLYNHFDSKEDLILQVLKRREEKYFSYLESSVSKPKCNSIALSLAQAHLNWIRMHETNGCMFLRAKEEFSSDSNNEIVRYVNKHKNSLIFFFKQLNFDYWESTRLALLFEGATALSEIINVDDVAHELMYCIKHLYKK